MRRFILEQNVQRYSELLGRKHDSEVDATVRNLLAEAKRELEELNANLIGDPDLRALLEDMLLATMSLHGADFGNVQLYDNGERTLRIIAHRNFGKPFLDHFARVDAADGSACGLALARGARCIVEDTEIEPDFAPSRSVARATGFRAVQSTPIIGADNQVLGMLSTHFRAPRRFLARDHIAVDVQVPRFVAAIVERTARIER